MIQSGIKRSHKELAKQTRDASEDIREKNRLKVQNHRERKKRYIENLERDNIDLRKRVAELTSKNRCLEDQLKGKECESEHAREITKENLFTFSEAGSELDFCELNFKRDENYILSTVPKMIKEEPQKVTYSLLSQSKEQVGVFGQERVALLKKKFNDIVDNILPLQNKIALKVSDEMTLSKWIRFQESKNNNFKMNDDTAGYSTIKKMIIKNKVSN
mmetsp:Transcript_6002/g.5170  ORF Transcript_6002/g.5170 Transcript_6002/m.5170 type:complete len:217 (+) Transcript_6002:3-653(+)